MPVATLNRRGQITLPSSVRDALGLQAGAKIDFVAHGDAIKLVALKNEVSSLKGRFAGRVPAPLSLEVMYQAIGDATASRDRRSGRRPRLSERELGSTAPPDQIT